MKDNRVLFDICYRCKKKYWSEFPHPNIFYTRYFIFQNQSAPFSMLLSFFVLPIISRTANTSSTATAAVGTRDRTAASREAYAHSHSHDQHGDQREYIPFFHSKNLLKIYRLKRFLRKYNKKSTRCGTYPQIGRF